jgi:hypothetical protein
MRHCLCGRAHGHARFTTRPRRTGFHWREGPAKRVRERTAMYPRHRGSVVPRDPDSVDVSQGLELCSQPWRTAGGGSPRAHPPRTIPKLRAANAGNTCNFEVSCAVLNGAAHIDFLMAFDQIHRLSAVDVARINEVQAAPQRKSRS